DSVDHIHRRDLIPLARALERLVTCLLRPWLVSHGDVERSLRSVRYLHGAVASMYGRIPWRVLSARARNAPLKRPGDATLLEFCGEIFDSALPDERTSRHTA